MDSVAGHVAACSFAVYLADLRLCEEVEGERLIWIDASAERAGAEDRVDATGLDYAVDVDDALSEADAFG